MAETAKLQQELDKAVDYFIDPSKFKQRGENPSPLCEFDSAIITIQRNGIDAKGSNIVSSLNDAEDRRLSNLDKVYHHAINEIGKDVKEEQGKLVDKIQSLEASVYSSKNPVEHQDFGPLMRNQLKLIMYDDVTHLFQKVKAQAFEQYGEPKIDREANIQAHFVDASGSGNELDKVKELHSVMDNPTSYNAIQDIIKMQAVLCRHATKNYVFERSRELRDPHSNLSDVPALEQAEKHVTALNGLVDKYRNQIANDNTVSEAQRETSLKTLDETGVMLTNMIVRDCQQAKSKAQYIQEVSSPAIQRKQQSFARGRSFSFSKRASSDIQSLLNKSRDTPKPSRRESGSFSKIEKTPKVSRKRTSSRAPLPKWAGDTYDKQQRNPNVAAKEPSKSPKINKLEK